MKNTNHLFRSLVLTAVISIASSCQDFLNEELTTQFSTDYLKTEEGIKSLADGMYYNLRYHFASEWAFTYTNYGTDEFRVGGDASNGMWNNYDANLSSQIPIVTQIL